jgi:hypothetical protein
VLRAHGVFVDENSDGAYELIREEFAECHVLEATIWKREIRYFWRKLNIPIHHFWHPEEAEKFARLKTGAEAEIRVKKQKKDDKALE